MTYLEAINSVLRRLREDEVPTWRSTPYSKLIGEFINDALIQVENACDWSGLRSSVLVTTSPNIFSYTLQDIYWNSEVSNLINSDTGFYLKYISQDKMSASHFRIDSQAPSQPVYYTINGTDADNNTIIDLFPIPDGTYQLYAEVVKRTDRLSLDDATIIVPYYPVVMLAYAFAIRERGEVGSDMVTEQLMAAKNALSDAVAIDMQRNREDLVWKQV